MKRSAWIFLAVCCIAAGCEILETDISGDRVRVLSPADGVRVECGEVAFRWMGSNDVTGYEFTLVSPSFDAAQRIVTDTVIYADTLARHYGCCAVLEEGEYEWRVTGFNSGYETRTEVRRLEVAAAAEEAVRFGENPPTE